MAIRSEINSALTRGMQKGKNFFQEYAEYIKDNPNRYWFKRRLYGWGWTPATWEGWLVIGVFLGVIVLNAFQFEALGAESIEDVAFFLTSTVLLVVALIGICFWKGESPKWMWGLPKKDEKE